MKQVFFIFIYLFCFCQKAVATSLYLYSDSEIPVRAKGDSNSKVIETLNAGESFEVLKWNTFNSRIRLSDGTIGFIERAKLENVIKRYAPEVLDPETENREFLAKPLKLTITNDDTVLIQNRAIPAANNNSTGNAEFSTNTRTEDLSRPGDVSEDLPDLDSGEFEEETSEQYVSTHREKFNTLSIDRYANLSQFALKTWQNAIEQRKVAKFMGRGYRSGNQSKGMCAQAVKDSLLDSNLCQSRPDGNAFDTHKLGTLRDSCSGLKLSREATAQNPLMLTDIDKAPGGSVIVYSGYAGSNPNNCGKNNPCGHIEIKVPITAELKKKMGKDGIAYEVGDYMFCSDFCRPTPTKKSTNTIEAIYTLR